jgi:hypothetical protein
MDFVKFNFHYCMMMSQKGCYMKFILILSFLVSLLLSSETRLIIGCFKEPKNAENAKIKIDKFIQSDTKFKNFLQENAVTTEYKVIGDWNVISFEPFSDNQTLYHTYFKIKDMYPDSYKIDMGAKGDQEIMASNYKNESENKKAMTYQNEMKEASSAKEESTMPVQNKQVQKSKAAEIIKDAIATPKKHNNDANSDTPYLYPLLAIVLIIVIFIIYFTQKKPKRPLQTLKENFEEDLS